MLSIKQLNFAYKKKKITYEVFDGLDISFNKGFNVVIGPNGAGKSTLLKAIFGLLDCDGQVIYKGKNIMHMNVREKTDLMAYLPQMDVDVSSLTVMEMVLLGQLPDLNYRIKAEDMDRVMEILEALNIEALAMRNFAELSGGQKKLVFIAQTLVREPKLILMDEPVNSLDLRKQLELCHLIRKIVKDKQIDFIVVLHDINLAARYAHHLVVLDGKGKCYASGTAKAVITREMLKSVYGVQANIVLDNQGIPIISPIDAFTL
ncbi:MAG: ABC transporter ATP-binding protein [Clostridia bacterium]|nr:ABC transporter ATP-binding protein [Clostridia bacterium]